MTPQQTDKPHMMLSVIDVLLLDEQISIRQHQAAEHFMDLCARSDMFVRSVSFTDCVSTGRVKKDKVYYFPYSRMIKMIDKKFGKEYSKDLHSVVIDNVYPSLGVDSLAKCLEYIAIIRVA